ncbi:MAG: EamA/RhaT family transporter [Gammaproteobacteria bacterium]|nr:EamA/RhaT family transporter [Gammaproteobacteria bacterium]
MLMLISAIACSVAVSVLLKLARSHNLQIAQSILVNYAVASALTLLLLKPNLAVLAEPSIHWLLLISLGILLPSVFFIMAKAVAHAGIALSDAAQRLSLFIPLLMAFLIFAEPLNMSKLAGIVLALAALMGLIYRPNKGSRKNTKQATWVLIGVWLGYGVIDVTFKQLAKTGAAFSASLLASFVLSGCLLLLWLLVRKTKWHPASLAAGIILGLFNFGNIYAYIRAHQTFPENPTLVFTAMNIGVISLGALIGVLLFKEKLHRVNVLGIALAVAAIVLLTP